MTPRQKEFCRHYLQGLPAKQAAERAGYSACTAERNAAQILRSDQVLAYLERKRAATTLFRHADLKKAKDRIAVMLDDANPRVALAAVREMRQLARTFPELFSTDPALDAAISPAIDCNKKEAQPTESQEKVAETVFIDIPEVDPARNYFDADVTGPQLEREIERIGKDPYRPEKDKQEARDYAAKRAGTLYAPPRVPAPFTAQGLGPGKTIPTAAPIAAIQLPRYIETTMANGRKCRAHLPVAVG